MFTKKTIREIDIAGKRVLVRADYNVPISNGKITDDYRIKQSLPTLQFLLEQGCSLVIISHLGRPKSDNDKDCSLEPVAKRLGELLEREVVFATDCVGQAASSVCQKLQSGQVALLENLRFHPEEEADDEGFAKSIIEASGAEVFVQDGFGVVHRAHASTDAIAKQGLPVVAGLLLEKEVDTITNVMQNPERPLVAVIGGAKISDKIEILQKLMDSADVVAVGGALANNFLKAEGLPVGQSLVEDEALDTARDILAKAREVEKQRPFHFLVPVDVVVSTEVDGSAPTRVIDLSKHTLADLEAYPKQPIASAYTVGADESILDIGPISAAMIAGALTLCRTAIWNGTLGVTETKGLNGNQAPFSHATKTVVDSLIGRSQGHSNKPFTVVGGGDTVGYVEQEGLVEDFNHVSTGGGASLELMSGRNLPGVDVLWNRD